MVRIGPALMAPVRKLHAEPAPAALAGGKGAVEAGSAGGEFLLDSQLDPVAVQPFQSGSALTDTKQASRSRSPMPPATVKPMLGGFW